MTRKGKTGTEPKYEVGITVKLTGRKKGTVIGRKWSSESGWWYDVRTTDSIVYSVAERNIEEV